jgi:type IV secretory pathway TrbD component
MTRPSSKALNKPLLIVGVDRRLAGLAFIFAVIVGANDGGSKIAVLLFIAMCVVGRRLTRKDPNIFLVLNQVRKQKALYDPAKRETGRNAW